MRFRPNRHFPRRRPAPYAILLRPDQSDHVIPQKVESVAAKCVLNPQLLLPEPLGPTSKRRDHVLFLHPKGVNHENLLAA